MRDCELIVPSGSDPGAGWGWSRINYFSDGKWGYGPVSIDKDDHQAVRVNVFRVVGDPHKGAVFEFELLEQ